MTPKEKAQELVGSFIGIASDEETTEDGLMYSEAMRIFNAKQCALIAVDEILKILPQNEYMEDRGEFNENRELIYWKAVKQEIENL